MKGAWQRIVKKLVVDSPWMKVYENSYRLPNGINLSHYYIWETGDSALCFCRVKDQAVLVRQYRPGIEKVTLCHPGGRLESSDISPSSGALREVLEETGFVSKSIKKIGSFGQVPALSPNRLHLFLVDCKKKQAALPLRHDHAEDIAIELVPLHKLEEVIGSGVMDCIACVALTYRVLRQIK